MVAMSCLRSAIRAEISGVVTVVESESVSMALDAVVTCGAAIGGVGLAARALLSWATASVIRLRIERISAFKDKSSAA